MIAVDTGILALALNRWAPEHARASRLVEGLANGEAPWAVTWPALHELVGRVTHRHDVARPLAPRDACGFVEELLASPSLRPLGPTARHAAVLRDVLESLGDEPPPPGFDSAVILREHGVRELIGTDPEDGDINIYLLEVRSVTAKLRNDIARRFRDARRWHTCSRSRAVAASGCRTAP